MKNIKWFNEIKNPLVREWFKYASEDFRYAKDTFKETENYRMICFICQQVVEKYLKGYLQFKQNKIPRIHNLVELLEMTVKFNKELLEFHEICKTLNMYYVDTRYPAYLGEIYKKEIAKEAIELTDEITEFIEKLFKSKFI